MDYIKKYRWLLLIAVFTVFLFIPYIISLLFSITAPYDWLAVRWDAADALLYFGTALGGIGTAFLGVITLIQTNRLKNNEIDKENADTQRPFFIIEDVSFKKSDGDKWSRGQNGFIATFFKSKYAYIKVVNIGDGVANNLVIEPWGFGDIPKENRPSFCITKHSYCNVPVSLSTKDTTSKTVCVDIIYQNIIGYSYSQKLELLIEFAPEQTGVIIDDEGQEHPEYEDSFKATVFNIYPQSTLGMHQYDSEKGKYLN